MMSAMLAAALACAERGWAVLPLRRKVPLIRGLAMLEGRWDWERPEAPLVAFFDGERHWLADGSHRCRAAKRAKIERVVVEVYKGDRRKAEPYAAGANKFHGVPRTNGTKKTAVIRALQAKEHEGWTQVQIAAFCGVSQQYVPAIAAKISGREYSSCMSNPSCDEQAGVEAEILELKRLLEDAENDARAAVARAQKAERALADRKAAVEPRHEAARAAAGETAWEATGPAATAAPLSDPEPEAAGTGDPTAELRALAEANPGSLRLATDLERVLEGIESLPEAGGFVAAFPPEIARWMRPATSPASAPPPPSSARSPSPGTSSWICAPASGASSERNHDSDAEHEMDR